MWARSSNFLAAIWIRCSWFLMSEQQPLSCGRCSVLCSQQTLSSGTHPLLIVNHSVPPLILGEVSALKNAFSTHPHFYPWLCFLSPPIFLLFNLTLPFASLAMAAQSDFCSSPLIAAVFPHAPQTQLPLTFSSATKSLPGLRSPLCKRLETCWYMNTIPR